MDAVTLRISILDNLSGPAVSMTSSIDMLTNRLNTVTSVSQKMDVSAPFKGIQEQTGAAASALDSMNGKLEKTDSLLQGLEASSSIIGVLKQLGPTCTALDSMIARLEKAGTILKGLETSSSVGGIKKQMDAVAGSAQSAERVVAKPKIALAAVSGAGNTASPVGGAQKQMDAAAGSAQSAERVVAKPKIALTAVSGAGDAAGSLASASAATDRLETGLAVAAQQTDSLAANLSKSESAMDASSASAGSMEKVLSGAAEKVFNMVGSVYDFYKGCAMMDKGVKEMADKVQGSFDGIKQSIGAQMAPAIIKVLEIVQANMPKIEQALTLFIPIIDSIIDAIGEIVEAAFAVVDFFISQWSVIEPIIYGIVAAFALWKIVTLVQTAITWLLTASNLALVASILANPLTWLVILIGGVIGAIAAWATSVGGFRILWLMIVNALLTTWDTIKIAFFTGIYWVLDLWDKLSLGFLTAKTEIQNFMGDLRVKVLMILESMINSAIDIINKFIGTVNNITGSNIKVIDHVTFGAEAELANKIEKDKRNQELADARAETGTKMASRAAQLDAMKNKAQEDADNRQSNIENMREAARQEKNKKKATSQSEAVADNLSGRERIMNASVTATATGGKTGTVDLGEDNLKYLREIAERDAINRFTTSEIHIEQHNENHIGSKMDLDGVVNFLAMGARDAIEESAEGVHA